MSALVTITADMPLAEQLALLDQGRSAGAVIVFVPSPDEAESLENAADYGDANHGDRTYADRMAEAMNDAEYMRQSDRHTYQEKMR